MGVMRRIAQHPTNRGKPLSAIMRWLRLCLASYLTPTRQIAIPYVGSAILNWPAGATSVMICARYGLSEYGDMAFCLHLLRPDDLFCDVGANAGVYTILAAHAVGCSVVAAEPVPRTFDLLMQNVYANGISEQVDARRVGVGRTPSSLYFTSLLWSYNHVVGSQSENTVEVEVQPLDVILGNRKPTAIKIDVEGFEAEVVAGATKTLNSPEIQAVIIEMCAGHVEKYDGKLEDIASTLIQAGLSGPYWYDPHGRKLIEAGTPQARKHNQIFVRDSEVVTTRLTNSRSYEIHGTKI